MSWLDYQQFAVFGLGRSGRAAARLLARRGKEVLASDTRTESEFADELDDLPDSVDMHLGGNAVGDAEVVVTSPGLRPSLEIFESVPDDVPIISEIELAWAASSVPFVGITGTDGKTTTTMLCAHILGEEGIDVRAAGNIGTPLCDVVDDVSADGCIVAEVSAFQLWSIHDFHAEAAAFTNIAADHLDYFDDFDEYVEAKRRLILNSGAEDWAAFNLDDARISGWLEDFPGRRIVYGFEPSVTEMGELALWSDGNFIFAVENGEEIRFLETTELQLRGRHNVANVMAAAGVARSRGVSFTTIARAVASFEPLPHRIAPVGTVGDVEFIDDSKATNVHAAVAGIESVEDDLVVIAGGVDKGLDLEPFASALGRRARGVVLIGAITDRLDRALREAGVSAEWTRCAGSMQEAVKLAYELAEPTAATVMLSPACSSFDMFDSYAHRGDVFQSAVEALREGGAQEVKEPGGEPG